MGLSLLSHQWLIAHLSFKQFVLYPSSGWWHSLGVTQQSCSLSTSPGKPTLCMRATRDSHLVMWHELNFTCLFYCFTFLPIFTAFYFLQDFWGHRAPYFCLKKILDFICLFFPPLLPLCSLILPSNQAAHINTLHSYFTVAVTEFFLIWVDHKRKKKENIDLFFSLSLSRVLKNVFDNANVFVLPEMSREKQTYLGRNLSSKGLPVSNWWVIRAKDREKRITGEMPVPQGREDMRIPFVCSI